MSQHNVEIVRRIYSGWAEGDFSVGVGLSGRNVTLVKTQPFQTGEECSLVGRASGLT